MPLLFNPSVLRGELMDSAVGMDMCTQVCLPAHIAPGLCALHVLPILSANNWEQGIVSAVEICGSAEEKLGLWFIKAELAANPLPRNWTLTTSERKIKIKFCPHVGKINGKKHKPA